MVITATHGASPGVSRYQPRLPSLIAAAMGAAINHSHSSAATTPSSAVTSSGTLCTNRAVWSMARAASR